MSTTLSWLINESSLTNIKCVSCEHLLDAPIKSVNIMENSDVLHWMTQDELVLTTGFCFINDEEAQVRIIHDLKKLGCCALMIKVNRFFSQTPEIMIREAIKIDFPILELPYYYRFADVSNVIYSQLERNRMTSKQYELEVFDQLIQSMLKGNDLTTMLMILGDVLNRELMIADYNYQTLAATFDLATLTQPPLLLDSTSNTKVNYSLKNAISTYYAIPLNADMGFLLISDEQGDLASTESSIISRCLHLLTLATRQSSLPHQISNEYRREFINFFTSNHMQSDTEIRLFCDLHHFNYHLKRVCLSILIPQAELLKNRGFQQSLITRIDDFLNMERICSYICTKTNYLFIFLLFPQEVHNTVAVFESKSIAQRISMEICQHYLDTYRIGIGRCHSKISTIKDALQDAMSEVQLANTLCAESTITTYFEHLPLHSIATLPREQIQHIYCDTLQSLDDYDKQNSTPYIETLRMYFSCSFNAAETAKALFLHRNTLAYRLDKIKSLLGMNLTDSSELFSLYYGLCALDILHSDDASPQ